jgi:hypothetical protein
MAIKRQLQIVAGFDLERELLLSANNNNNGRELLILIAANRFWLLERDRQTDSKCNHKLLLGTR